MTMSPFALLEETPRPFLDLEALKAKFLKLSAPVHPDRVHHLSDDEKQKATGRFSELNGAYLLLRDPRRRIEWLIENETGIKLRDVQKIPPGTMDLFMEIGQFCRDFDSFLEQKSQMGDSPLLKATMVVQQQQWRQKLDALDARLCEKAAGLGKELLQLDAQWSGASDRKPLLESLENLARAWSYLNRWEQQLGERKLKAE